MIMGTTSSSPPCRPWSPRASPAGASCTTSSGWRPTRSYRLWPAGGHDAHRGLDCAQAIAAHAQW